MGAIATVGKFVGGLFGGGVAPDTRDLVHDAVRGVGTWIDERDFTEEEKQKADMEVLVKYAQFIESTITENSERSKTRRNLAMWIIRLEGFLLLLSVALYRVDIEMAEYVYKVATESYWGWLTLGVGAFFFGVHMLRDTKWSK